ncbi:hypothetical protein CC2G_009366 [Coprinopsis cinerea AmutBmut pab1-1]|nr:hypothetical protein CC2G_009366 [Coprinopsis cinerea AmutBmut pab1-1]
MLMYGSLAACLALWIADYFDMLPLEISCVWNQKLSKVNILYFILKYFPAVHIPSFFLYSFLTSIPPHACKPIFILNTIFVPVIISCAQAVLFLRIHILGQSKRLTIYLIAHYVISIIAIFTLSIVFYTELRVLEFLPHEFFGCGNLIANGDYTSGVYGIVLFNELVMAILNLVLSYRKYVASRSTPLMRIFRRDGTGYFIALAVVSTINILVNRLHPDPQYSFLLAVVQYALHPIFTTRMILHLRQVAMSGGSTNQSISQNLPGRAKTANIRLSALKPKDIVYT